ncbi:MAG TPA: CHAT domain-containing tetratricopeptide repeat protein [Candidatus Angelobacter sp.]|nr:CHAT domain-containing tetratricopeptide repeat protein [Candidatus Angelobacter sp.]
MGSFPELAPGQVIHYNVHYGQKRSVAVRVKQGFFARIIVDQINIDIGVTISTSSGRQIARVDRPNGPYGPEAISFIAPESGTYIVTIGTELRFSDEGKIHVRLVERRLASPDDRSRIRAEQLCSEAEVLRGKSQEESHRQALSMFAESAALWHKLNEPYEAAVALYGVGITARAMGLYTQAETSLRQSATLMHHLRKPYGKTVALAALGWVYFYLGDDTKTREALHHALAINRVIGNRRGMGQNYYILGVMELRSGRYLQAQVLLERARSLRAAAGDQLGAALANSKLAATMVFTKQYDQALKLLTEVQEKFKELHQPYNLADSQITMGFLLLQQGNTSEAAKVVQDALRFLQGTGNIMDTFNSRFLVARIAIQENRLHDAEAQLESLVSDAENIKSEVPSEQQRITYVATFQDFYALLCFVLLQLDEQEHGKGFDRRAFETFERASSQALIEKMTGRHFSTHTVGQSGLEFRPNVLHELQQKVLRQDSVLLAYFLNQYCSCVFVVTADEEIRSFYLADLTSILHLARRISQNLASSPDTPTTSALKELSDALLKPAAAELRVKNNVVVVSQGVLDPLPIALLADPNSSWQLTLDLHEVSQAPSASYLAYAQSRFTATSATNNKKLLVFADPILDRDDPRLKRNLSSADSDGSTSRLVFTRLEAEEIIDSLPKGRYAERYGLEFTKEAVQSVFLNHYQYVHFATHSKDAADMLGGTLLLSYFNSSGEEIPHTLTSHEIERLNLTGQLVTLSACRTSAGEQISGEGIVGLTRAFLYAGARTVISSKWMVEDRATAELMSRLYRHLMVRRESPARALAQAQREMRRTTRWRHSYYWASFGVYGMGNWR